MQQRISPVIAKAISPVVIVGSEKTSTVTDDSNPDDWFGRVARPLLGKDPGVALRILAELDQSAERSCYRYARGETQPPGYILFKLLRSRLGRSWLNGFMDGSDAPWFRGLQRAERIVGQIDGLDLS